MREEDFQLTDGARIGIQALALCICSNKASPHLSNGEALSTAFRCRANARTRRCATGSPLLESSTSDSLARSLMPLPNSSRRGDCKGRFKDECATVFWEQVVGASSPMTRRIFFAGSDAIIPTQLKCRHDIQLMPTGQLILYSDANSFKTLRSPSRFISSINVGDAEIPAVVQIALRNSRASGSPSEPLRQCFRGLSDLPCS